MTIRFERTDDGNLRVVDPIERRHLVLTTGTPAEPEPASTDEFLFPVGAACTVSVPDVALDRVDDAYVRGPDGQQLASVLAAGHLELPPREYVVEVSAPIKLYLQFESALEVDAGTGRIRFSFGGPTTVAVGARSYHKRPAGTITTPDDPAAMMTAVSALASALKTTSCERAYPTLRGHPPLVEVGEELAVPGALRPPDTGVELVVPPTYEYVFAGAPLAYYTGATMVEGETPHLRTEGGWRHDLGGWSSFEDEVADTLKQVLLLDCIVRTEGLYPVELHERTVLEGVLPFDLGDLYARSIADQLETYLSVPYHVVEDYVPQWVLTAHIPAEPAGVEALPFVLNELGVVRLPRGTRIDSPYERTSTYTRSPHRPSVPAPEEGTAVRGGDAGTRVDAGARGDAGTRGGLRSERAPSRADETADDDLVLVQPERTNESIEHAWFGEHLPRGASKATVAAFRSKLERDPPGDRFDVTVVCNDAEMVGEQESLDDLYGDRTDLDLGVSSHHDLSTSELASVLANPDGDFLHFIGHASPGGLHCHDGKLDVHDIESVGIDAFLLNACQSYRQAAAMTERGAIGGIGTLGDVENEYAGEIGETMARLLNLGFRLRSALELVREHTVIGEQYIVFGDGSVDLAQPETGAPFVTEAESRPDGDFDVTIHSYPMSTSYLGGTVSPSIQQITTYYLAPGRTESWRFTEAELRDYLDTHGNPVRVDGDLKWNRPVDE